MSDRYITVAIHTYEKALALRSLLESENIPVEFRNVNIEQPAVSSGIRVRIREADLPLALRIIENREIFTLPTNHDTEVNQHKPIIVPVDFSDLSLKAAQFAFALANLHHTSIVLMHTYLDPYVAGNMQLTDSLTYELTDMNARENIENTANTQMRHFATRIKQMIKNGQMPPVKFTTTVVEGVPEDAITDYARANNPFLIVMGTRGPRKKELDMIGSVTAEVLDRCRFSVLAVPEDADKAIPEVAPKPLYKNIIFFSNVDQQDILALDTLYRFFPVQGAKVTIVALPTKKRPFVRNTAEALKAIGNYCRQNFTGYQFETKQLSPDNTLEDIKHIESDNRFDLIVIPNKKKNILTRIFNPSLAHRILFSSELPMLVIPV